MDDFLIGREVVSRSDSGATAPENAVTLPNVGRTSPESSEPEMCAPQSETGANGSRIETVVERGRVTRLIVTCNCGNVTEIECRY